METHRTDLAGPWRGVTGARKAQFEEAFIDASFTGEKGGLAVGPTERGKVTKIIVLADDHSLPLAVSIESASPHESQLVEGLLGHSYSTASRRY